MTTLKFENCRTHWIQSTFDLYQKVRTLDISYANFRLLNDLDVDFEHLERLNVSHNYFEEISSHLFITNTGRLTEVDFSYNKMKKLDVATFSKMVNLSTINLSHNHIKDLGLGLFSMLPDLETLDLSDNVIRRLPRDLFAMNPKVKILNLEENLISCLDCGI